MLYLLHTVAKSSLLLTWDLNIKEDTNTQCKGAMSVCNNYPDRTPGGCVITAMLNSLVDEDDTDNADHPLQDSALPRT